MKSPAKLLAAAFLVLATVSAPAWTQSKGSGHATEKQPSSREEQTAGDKIREVLPASQPVFVTREITIIRDYFATHQGGLPPGLAKRETLPPGLQKHLERNGTLPPGLQKKIQPLPLELEKQLVVLPTGYRRVVVAGNVILMNPTTGLIYDIIRSVIP
jgi:hypothetical protein